jgi:hypothetical protein
VRTWGWLVRSLLELSVLETVVDAVMISYRLYMQASNISAGTIAPYHLHVLSIPLRGPVSVVLSDRGVDSSVLGLVGMFVAPGTKSSSSARSNKWI